MQLQLVELQLNSSACCMEQCAVFFGKVERPRIFGKLNYLIYLVLVYCFFRVPAWVRKGVHSINTCSIVFWTGHSSHFVSIVGSILATMGPATSQPVEFANHLNGKFVMLGKWVHPGTVDALVEY